MPTRPEDPAVDPMLATATPAPGAPVPGASAMRPGTIVGDSYQVIRLLGQGGMGAVWEAKHLRLPDMRVVVKVLLYGGTDAVALARFRREAEIASKLGHPNIVQVLDFNTLPDGSPYIVLELLRGESLAARLARGRLALEQVTAIVSQIGSGLAAAHRAGVVHRDLKPDNIFLCPTEIDGEARDVAKILDFGISKIRGSQTVLTQDSSLIGTPQYMAPEQATGRNDAIDARTDIFAFGAIVFEMLAGSPPFTGDTLAAVIHAVVYAPTPPLGALAPGTPPAVVAAVERALAKQPDERFPDVASFVKAVTARSLETARAALAATATQSQIPTAPMTVVPAPSSPRRTGIAIAGLFAIAGIAVAVWLPSLRDKPGPAPTAPATPAVTAPEPPRAPVPATLPVATPPVAVRPDPPATATAGDAKRDVDAKRGDGDKNERLGPGKAKPVLSAAAADELKEAEEALGAGRTADAIRLAQHSLYAQQSSEAYALIARARCAQGDLGNAKAALAKVATRERGTVVRACGKLGVELR